MSSSQPWDYDILCKILVVGDSGVGKSCLLTRYSDDTFSNTHMATIGVDFKLKSQVYDNRKIKVQIWDTAGQERFRTITSSYYRGAHGILIVFDVTNDESFKDIPSWVDEIRNHASPNVQLVLVGNKADKTNKRVVSQEQAKQYAEEQKMPYVETSAREAYQVDTAFTTVIDCVVQSRNYLENIKKEGVKELNSSDPNKDVNSSGNSCAC
eukprot:gene11667-4903_t